MKRVVLFGLLATLSSLLGGCATVGDRVGGPLARCDSQRSAAHRDVDRRVDVASRVEVFQATTGTREGTPTPEPALPEPRFAGPTPQVPIPVIGSASVATNW